MPDARGSVADRIAVGKHAAWCNLRSLPRKPRTCHISRPNLVALAMLLHGSCAALDGEAVLLLAPPGGGKSDLLLRLLGRGWRLVADDPVTIRPGAQGLTASPPAALAGALEVRGLGLLAGLDWAAAPLRLVARLVARTEVPRLPEPDSWRDAGPPLPLLRLDPFAASAPDLLTMALRVLGGGASMRAGALCA